MVAAQTTLVAASSYPERFASEYLVTNPVPHWRRPPIRCTFSESVLPPNRSCKCKGTTKIGGRDHCSPPGGRGFSYLPSNCKTSKYLHSLKLFQCNCYTADHSRRQTTIELCEAFPAKRGTAAFLPPSKVGVAIYQESSEVGAAPNSKG